VVVVQDQLDVIVEAVLELTQYLDHLLPQAGQAVQHGTGQAGFLLLAEVAVADVNLHLAAVVEIRQQLLPHKVFLAEIQADFS
jgi:hypothetical protein